jgi:hypothetical protein
MAEEFAEPVRQSYLMWFFSALGWRYTLLLPLAGLLAFVLTLLVVTRGKGAAQVGALLFIVPLPVLVGIYGVVEGLIASYQVIAMTSISPKPSAIAEGVSMSLVTIMVGMVLATPSYLLAVAGLIVRSLTRDEPPAAYPPAK